MIYLTSKYSDQSLRKKLVAILQKYAFDQKIYINFFVEAFCRRYNMIGGLCTNSGTNALIMVLHSLQIKSGDAVLLPTYTCKAILDALVLLGINPVFADNYLDYKQADFNLDEADVGYRLASSKVKAIILPYMFGKIHHYKNLFNLSLPIIEDITLSLGSPSPSIMGNQRRIIIASFFSTKVISAVEGGIVATTDPELLEQLRHVSNVDETNREERRKKTVDIRYELAFSFRPSELNFIWGFIQFNRLDNLIAERQRLARYYIKNLDANLYELPDFDESNVYFRFMVGLRQGDVISALSWLTKNGIEGGRGVYPLLSTYLNLDEHQFPRAKLAVGHSLSIPLHPSLSLKEVKHIIKTCNVYAGRK